MLKDIDSFISGLQPGDTFYFKGHIDEAHYQIILNSEIDPFSKFLFLSISTSQVEKKLEYHSKRHYDLDTIVVVEEGEVDFLSKKSCFNCNDPMQYAVFDLYGRYISGELIYKGKLPSAILDKIYNGIRISVDVPKRTKKIILGY